MVDSKFTATEVMVDGECFTKVSAEYLEKSAAYVEIQINDTGEMARFRQTVHCYKATKIRCGRWQKIKYTADGSPYIQKDGRHLYLHKSEK